MAVSVLWLTVFRWIAQDPCTRRVVTRCSLLSPSSRWSTNTLLEYATTPGMFNQTYLLETYIPILTDLYTYIQTYIQTYIHSKHTSSHWSSLPFTSLSLSFSFSLSLSLFSSLLQVSRRAVWSGQQSHQIQKQQELWRRHQRHPLGNTVLYLFFFYLYLYYPHHLHLSTLHRSHSFFCALWQQQQQQ